MNIFNLALPKVLPSSFPEVLFLSFQNTCLQGIVIVYLASPKLDYELTQAMDCPFYLPSWHLVQMPGLEGVYLTFLIPSLEIQ
jgi:hypothetical protein